MKHDVREPFRTIHGCIRRERNLETGHDTIPWSFPECMHCWHGLTGFRCRMFGCFHDFGFVSGLSPPQTIGMDAS